MARFINDESEAAGLIFAGRHKKLPHFARRTVAAELGKTFDKAWMMARRDGGYHDPIGSVILLKLPLVLRAGFFRLERHPVQMFPLIGIIIAQ